jgi:hypothetical protein
MQALPTQLVPVGQLGVFTQPVIGSQLSVVQSEPSSQLRGALPTQVPAKHASVCVQALLSLQIVPSALFGFEHVPVLELQVPTL